MKLSIVIPYHKESLNFIKPLLRSLNEQVGVNYDEIEFLFCKDTEEYNELDDYDFNEFENLKGRVRTLISPYPANPGMSRQLGINEAKGEYVFFCDADDSLYHLGVFRELLDNINHSQADVYRFKFIEEIGSFFSNDLIYDIKGFNWVWVFAKAYRVQFLKEHNICFNPNIRWHEDTYFNLLCQYCQPKTIDIDSKAYLWRFNKQSITRVNNHEYTFNTIDEYLDAISKAFDKIRNEYHLDCAIDIIKVINTYYKTLLHPDNRNQPKYEYIEKCYYEFVRRFANNLFDEIPLDIQKVFASLIWSGDRDFLPELSLNSYLKYLKEKYNNGLI